jgi:molybdopterin/thiamine biosynthesis adenylyltransferase
VLSDHQLLRYNRQIMLPELDIAGQERLLAARVLVVGLGGLGCPASLYLAAAGVGGLRLVDNDVVESSNLQRQIAHGEADLGELKVDSAARSIAALNSETRVEKVSVRADADSLPGLLEGVDLVVDASDSFATRFGVNQACVDAKVPLVSGAAIRSEGQVGVFDPTSGGACYRCLYPGDPADADLSCAESGVLAPMVGIIGSLQALEAVKVLAGFGEPLRGKLLLIDGWSLQVRRINLQRDPRCPVCASR